MAWNIKLYQETLYRLRDNDPGMKKICFSNRDLTTEDIEVLAEALAKNKELTSLDLSNNGLDDRASNALLYGLDANRTLTRLDISGSNISQTGWELISSEGFLPRVTVLLSDYHHHAQANIKKLKEVAQKIPGVSAFLRGADSLEAMNQVSGFIFPWMC